MSAINEECTDPVGQECVLVPLGLTAAAAPADTDIHKRILGSGTATLNISNKKMRDIMKVVKALEDWSINNRCYSNNWKWKKKEKSVGFLWNLFGILSWY